MTLEEKGPIIAPPRLSKFPQEVSKEIQAWKDIISATHWHLYNRTEPDGADFYLGKMELGHIHLDGEVHLATGTELKTMLIKKKLANRFAYGDGWVTTQISTAKDVLHATWLFKLNYQRLQGMSNQSLASEIENYSKQ